MEGLRPGARVYALLQKNHRLKNLARSVVASVLRLLPQRISYQLRKVIERFIFSSVERVDSLPPIFHYWSNKYLLPRLQDQGYDSPTDFFLKEVGELARSRPILRCLSVASGRCEMEIAVARHLLDRGIVNFSIQCVDISETMLEDARIDAHRAGVDSFFSFRVDDVNDLAKVNGPFDVVIANQCLHHFVELEKVFSSIDKRLAQGGVFLTSDVIGRNGHLLWPEQLAIVTQLWNRLPREKRFDRATGAVSEGYVNFDHSNVGFEGIRSQDILELLLSHFVVEKFIAYGGVILPFIERRFGWNFDPESGNDLEFIDKVAQLDAKLLESGEIKPTQLLAKLRKQPWSSESLDPNILVRARRAIRHPDPA